ncbi:hypothetical protein BDW22DRAFT_915673 [Trametopsis cervina]|nr:hypothetical protein BDW22DRAFT_915673 [Trametopsis cervina]
MAIFETHFLVVVDAMTFICIVVQFPQVGFSTSNVQAERTCLVMCNVRSETSNLYDVDRVKGSADR